MNDPQMRKDKFWVAFNPNSIFCDLFNLFRLFPKQNSLHAAAFKNTGRSAEGPECEKRGGYS